MISLVLLCILSAVVPAAKAAETYGSVRVKLDAQDLAVTNGAVTLYQVGVRVEDGYRIAESFGGGIIRQQDVDSTHLAQWLAESAEENGITMLLDADGNAIFSDLEEGLYILVQTERMDGFYPILPVLLTIPEGDRWNLELYRQLSQKFRMDITASGGVSCNEDIRELNRRGLDAAIIGKAWYDGKIDLAEAVRDAGCQT